jgi:DnaJ-class molecular chaperone
MAADTKDFPVAHAGAGDPIERKPVFGEWQLCPKCNGEGKIIADYWDGTVYVSQRTCPVCNGAKVLARPIINHP